MSRQVCTTVYQFHELSDKAKETARDWYRSRHYSDFDSVIEDAIRMGEIMGIDFDTSAIPLMNGGTRREPCVWWSVDYCQSDGAGFDGTYSYATNAHGKIREEAPEDADLHAMADTLSELQRKNHFKITATIKDRNYHPTVEINPYDLHADDDKALQDVFRDFNRWIYKQLCVEDEYQRADLQVDEAIEANEYEFTERGDGA